MTLVENAKDAWRWISVQAMTLAGALQGAWLYIPEDLKANIPAHLVNGLTILLLIAGIVGRLVKQDATKP